MSRLRRCLSGSAVSLMFACAGCFSPTGSVTVSTDTTDTSTTGPGVTTTTGDTSTASTSITGSASVGTDPTLTTDPTTTTLDPTTTTLDPTTTTLDPSTTGSTTEVGPKCGDGNLDLGEDCDEGPGNSDNGRCTSGCKAAKCGDGLRCSACDPVEECDGANDICSDMCVLQGKLIFATATLHQGNVGIMAADQICQDVGDIYFSKPRNFIAWLSGSQAIASRIGSSVEPYRLPRGQIVANSSKALLNTEILHAVDQDPLGDTITAENNCEAESLVWTGTVANGGPGMMHCNDWTSTSGLGLAGSFVTADFTWTERCDLDCSSFLRLYCIQTPPV